MLRNIKDVVENVDKEKREEKIINVLDYQKNVTERRTKNRRINTDQGRGVKASKEK